jgi:hypothetical protein
MNRFNKITRFSNSILFLAASVLLASLWVRSYERRDTLVIPLPGASSASFESDAGELRIAVVPIARGWSVTSKVNSQPQTNTNTFEPTPVEAALPWGPVIGFPHWYLAFVSAVIAGLPWIRWRPTSNRPVHLVASEPQLGRRLERVA